MALRHTMFYTVETIESMWVYGYYSQKGRFGHLSSKKGTNCTACHLSLNWYKTTRHGDFLS